MNTIISEATCKEIGIAIMQQAHEDYLKWSLSKSSFDKKQLKLLVCDMKKPPISWITADIDTDAIFRCWDKEVENLRENNVTMSEMKILHRGRKNG